jgi:hypothetical protein
MRTPACLVVAIVLGACSPTFAPPVRTGIGSVPNPSGDSPAATVVAWGGQGKGHIRMVHRLSDELDVESTVVSNIDRDNPAQRFFLAGPGLIGHMPTAWSWLQSAWVVGFAVGCGGARDGVGGCNRAAGGTHIGLDLGSALFWGFHLYLAQRLQVSFAENVPTTLWGLHAVGLQWDASPRWFLSLEVARWWYKNRAENEDAAIANLGLGFRWDDRYSAR